MISRQRFGEMAAIQNRELKSLPLSEVAGKIKLVPRDYPLISHARSLDTCFGARL
jgi:6-phosphofructokinase 1